MTTRLSLVCNAPTAASRGPAFPTDEPLDPRALNRLGVAAGWHNADCCLASPALRAVQTAEALLLNVVIDPALRDLDYGRWAGRTFDDVQAAEPDAISEWMRDPAVAPPGGEFSVALIARIAAWLDGQSRNAGRVIAVTHAAVMRAAIVHAIGAPAQSLARIDIAPLSMVRLSGHDGRWNLVSVGDRPGS